MTHLEAYKYLRDLGFRVHVSTTISREGRRYNASAFLAEECRSHLAAGISCRAESSDIKKAIISMANQIKANVAALQECSSFVGEEFFRMTIEE